MSTVLLYPVLALVALTALVWALALRERVAEIRARRIPLRVLARPAEVARTLEATQAMDNFNNLLQLPLLFYVLCLALTVTGQGGAVFVAGAWGYVALRAVHSAIQVGRNAVLPRFRAWVASSLLLWALWALFAWRLLRADLA